MKQRKCAFVIGTDRGGIARTAGILTRLGFAAPIPEPTGNAWNGLLATFNTQVLQSEGRDGREWHAPQADWRSAAGTDWRDSGTALLNDMYGDAATIALHDGRMAALADLWLEILAANGFATTVFLPLCHPAQVAASLHRRDGIDTVQAQYQWLRTMLNAERRTRGHGRFLFHIADLLRDWRGTFSRAPFPGESIIPAADDAADRAVDSWLATASPAPHAPPDAHWEPEPLVAEAYAIFARWAEEAENPADHERLDAIGQEFARFARAARPLALSMEGALRRAEQGLAQSREELVQALDDIVSIGTLLRNEERNCAQLAEQVMAERLAGKSSAALLEKADYLRTTLAEERAKRKVLLASMQDRDVEFRLLHEKTEQLREHKQRTEAKLAKLREQKELDDARLSKLRETSQAELARLKAELAESTRRCAEADKAKSRAEGDLRTFRGEHEALQARLAAATGQRGHLEQRVQQANAAAAILQKMAEERLAFPSARPASGLLGGGGQGRWRAFCSGLAEAGLFDADEYLAANPDVAAAQFDPLTHYLTRGLPEGRPLARKAPR